jgi:hypothetical protein
MYKSKNNIVDCIEEFMDKTTLEDIDELIKRRDDYIRYDCKIFKNMYINECQEYLKKKIKLEVKNDFKNNILQYNMTDLLMPVYNKCENNKEKYKDFYFITINPAWDQEGFNEDEFIKACHEMCRYCWAQEGMWCIEQRGTSIETLGQGIHYHMLLKKYNIGEKKLRDNLYNKFKSFFTKKCKLENVVNVKRKSIQFLQDKIDYIKGLKEDEDKLVKCKFDKEFRKLKHLEEYYEFFGTNKKNSKGCADARINNGGKRAGAGRPRQTESNEKTVEILNINQDFDLGLVGFSNEKIKDYKDNLTVNF